MRQTARWITIIASLGLACAGSACGVRAATSTKPAIHRSHERRVRERSAHASYRPTRYARQSSSTNSHGTHRKTKKAHHYTHRRYSRRRYHHRVVLPKAPSPERITQIQTALARGGYYNGDPTGRWDSGTVAAVQKFQSANNIDATGKLDAPTLQKLGLGSDIAGVAAPKTVVPKVCCTTTAPAPAPIAPPKPAGLANPAPVADGAQPVATTSGNAQNSVAVTSASSTTAVTPAAASTGGASGTSGPASATKPAAAQR